MGTALGLELGSRHSRLSAVCAHELQLNWNYALCDGADADADPRGLCLLPAARTPVTIGSL